MNTKHNITDQNQLISMINEKLNFINNSIYELNEFSNNDFKTLSSTFKQYYEDITLIYNNTNESFKEIISTQKSKITSELASIKSTSSDLVKELLEIIQLHQIKQKQYNQGKNLLFMHINNLRQNIKTYELLIANITLGKKLGRPKVGDKIVLDAPSRETLRDSIKNIWRIQAANATSTSPKLSIKNSRGEEKSYFFLGRELSMF